MFFIGYYRGVERVLVKGLLMALEGVEVSDLQFADDISIFLSNDRLDLGNVFYLLRVFESQVSWTQINMS